MIFIKRNSVEIPDILKEGSVKLQKELDEAIAHYSDPDNLKKAYKFKVYSNAKVKAALIEMGKGKCAYCECDILATYVGDIEHFRPKGEIEELKATGNSKPGYYWLAADWNNLLLSCRNCNQKSKQRTSSNDELNSMGKMNQFPLFDEAKRIRSHEDDLEQEEKVRLLLNPCVEDPEEYFKYDINSGVIQPKKRKEFLKQRAVSSINVFALQRVPLVHARAKRAIEISAQMQTVETAFRTYNNFYDAANADTHYLRDELKKQLKRLKGFLKEKEQFLGLARQMIGKFMKNFNTEIEAT
ncbi:retron system putative HNH endonuclease [uncultured Kordia sp.]|uniref:retron system putative HNH endonuclease n=1 Tax=uncultured Kordia sp. TaxID=507699 RepID=UPI0026224AE5|nr:retron system putative HNH endonuclease [uncultured Kordia sp.]